jgi:aspartate-semialdehyde dehydrogenase
MCACHVAVVGATGLVGQEVLRVLEERNFPLSDLTLLVSAHSEGKRLEFRQRSVVARLLTADAFTGVDIAFFAAGEAPSRDYAPSAVQAGAVVIDNSSAFRLSPTVPLCVPEINAAALQQHQGIVAIPHSLTTQVGLVLAPLHAAAPLTRVLVSTYQGISGRGQHAVREFDQQLRDLLNFRPVQSEVLPHQIAFNCLPQGGEFLDNTYTEEEMALINETPKLLGAPDLAVAATVVYVPLVHSHCASVYLETARPLSVQEVRDLLAQTPSVVVEDDYHHLRYPQAIQANSQDEVFVGRIRADLSIAHGLHLWVAMDNLRKGAALNAVQVAEHLIKAQG